MKIDMGILMFLGALLVLNGFFAGCLDVQNDEMERSDGCLAERDEPSDHEGRIDAQEPAVDRIAVDEDRIYPQPDYDNYSSLEHFDEAYSLAKEELDRKLLFRGVLCIADNLSEPFNTFIFEFTYYDYDVEKAMHYTDRWSRVIYEGNCEPFVELHESIRLNLSEHNFRGSIYDCPDELLSCQWAYDIALGNEAAQRYIGNESEHGVFPRIFGKFIPISYSWRFDFFFHSSSPSETRTFSIYVSREGEVTLVSPIRTY